MLTSKIHARGSFLLVFLFWSHLIFVGWTCPILKWNTSDIFSSLAIGVEREHTSLRKTRTVTVSLYPTEFQSEAVSYLGVLHMSLRNGCDSPWIRVRRGSDRKKNMWKKPEEILTRFLWLYIHLCGKKDFRHVSFPTWEAVMEKWAWIDCPDMLMW